MRAAPLSLDAIKRENYGLITMTETILRQTTKINYKTRLEIYSGDVCSTWDKKLYLSLSRSKTIDAFAQESPRVRDLILAKLRQVLFGKNDAGALPESSLYAIGSCGFSFVSKCGPQTLLPMYKTKFNSCEKAAANVVPKHLSNVMQKLGQCSFEAIWHKLSNCVI